MPPDCPLCEKTLENSPDGTFETVSFKTPPGYVEPDLEGHPDNVAPAVHGGLVLGIQGSNGLIIEQFQIPSLNVVIVLPDYQLLTADARAALPDHIPLQDAIFNASRIGLLFLQLKKECASVCAY